MAMPTDAVTSALLHQILTQQTSSLAGFVAPREPGTYLLKYCGDLEIYRLISRRWYAYTGSTDNLHRRLTEHRNRLSRVTDIDVTDIEVMVIPTATEAEAKYLEDLVINHGRTIWNHLSLRGMGSKAQGTGRCSVQHRAPWDVLHPSTGARHQPERASRTELQQLVRAELHDAFGHLDRRSTDRTNRPVATTTTNSPTLIAPKAEESL